MHSPTVETQSLLEQIEVRCLDGAPIDFDHFELCFQDGTELDPASWLAKTENGMSSILDIWFCHTHSRMSEPMYPPLFDDVSEPPGTLRHPFAPNTSVFVPRPPDRYDDILIERVLETRETDNPFYSRSKSFTTMINRRRFIPISYTKLDSRLHATSTVRQRVKWADSDSDGVSGAYEKPSGDLVVNNDASVAKLSDGSGRAVTKSVNAISIEPFKS